jgi:hypothetical protein
MSVAEDCGTCPGCAMDHWRCQTLRKIKERLSALC